MTEAQRKKFYFPAWRRAFDANWTKSGGVVLPRPDRRPSDELAAIEDMAARFARLAAREGRPTEEDYRHAANFVATAKLRQCLGGPAAKVRPKSSSTDFTTQETNHAVALFALLADSASLKAAMRWNNPQLAEEDQIRASLEAIARRNPAYVSALARSPRFGGCLDWRRLEFAQLKQLLLTLQNRTNAQRPPVPGKLEYVKKGSA